MVRSRSESLGALGVGCCGKAFEGCAEVAFRGRVDDWRVRSGRVLVSNVACIEVGEDVERTLVCMEWFLIWYRRGLRRGWKGRLVQ